MLARSSRSRVAFASFAALLVLGACAAPQPAGTGAVRATAPVAAAAAAPQKPLPELVPAPPPASLGPAERFAWQTVTQLGEAVAAGDAPGFLGKVSRGFYRGYGALETSLGALFGQTTARTVVVAVREVQPEGDRVSVRAAWTRTFVRKDGSRDGRYGETLFLFLRSDKTLRLLDYQGDPPFGLDGI